MRFRGSDSWQDVHGGQLELRPAQHEPLVTGVWAWTKRSLKEAVMADGVDWSFISQNEGGQQLSGYVLPGAGKAGLTIGTGVDMSAMTADQLNALPISDSAKSTLQPFCGLQGQDAIDAYNNYVADHGGPPEIDQDSATTLDQHAAETTTLNPLSDAYHNATGLNFSDLPSQVQTALADVAYQYGPDLATAAPKLWQDVIDGDWDAVANELDDFGDAYGPRRKKEAGLVRNAVDSGAFGPGTRRAGESGSRDTKAPEERSGWLRM